MFLCLWGITILVALYLFLIHHQIVHHETTSFVRGVPSPDEFRWASVRSTRSSSSSRQSHGLKDTNSSLSLRIITDNTVVVNATESAFANAIPALNLSKLPDVQGALDENGNPGYIHDPTYIRMHPPHFNFYPDAPGYEANVCDGPPGTGIEGSGGIHGLRKIQICNESSIDANTTTKVLCIVYTHEGAHERALQAVIETYGQRCDGFMAASNATDRKMGAVNILKKGPEAYANMWQKTRSIWQYVYDNYLEDYDWFHIGGDNMFVIAENLRFAAHQETQRQVVAGRQEPFAIYMGGAMVLPPRRKWRLCGGGGGYSLNRHAVRLMVRDEFSKPHCEPDTLSPKEDFLIAKCLRENVGSCVHSTDDKLEARYHPYDVEFHATWKRWKVSNWHWPYLKSYHGIDFSQEGLESIASSTVSFHLTGHKNITTKFRDMGIRRYHAIVYGLCPNHVYEPFDPNVEIMDVSPPIPLEGMKAYV